MGPFDILSELHRELEDRLSALGSAQEPGASDTWHERFEALVAALRVHARLEERHLYPVLSRVEGRAQAHQQAEDQLTVRELLEELEELEPGAEEWWARFTALEDLIVAHVHEEEMKTFPLLTSALDTEEQSELHQALLTLREALVSESDTVSGSERLLEEPRGSA